MKTWIKNILLLEKHNESPKQNEGFHINIEKSTLDNKDYRKVLFTTADNQLVLMSLNPKEEIGMEVHDDTAQFLRFERGEGKCIIGEKEYNVKDGDSVIIPQGVKHNVINTSEAEKLKLYTLYSPPVHKDGVVFKTKKDAEKEEGVIATHKA